MSDPDDVIIPEILNPGDVILPEMVSADGKLILKEMILPECFKYRNPSDWTLNAFLHRLYKISKENINNHSQMYSFLNGLNGNDPYTSECLEKSLESILGNPDRLINEIKYAIEIRLVELGFNINIWVNLVSDYSLPLISNMMVYNGKCVSKETLKRLAVYHLCIYYLKRNEIPIEFQKNCGEIIKKIKAAGVPTTNCISWALEMISNE